MTNARGTPIKKNIRICFFPGRESSYARNRVLLKGMKEAGLTAYDCSCPNKNFLRYIPGFWKFLTHKSKSDIILVGFLGHFLVPFVKLFTRKKIIFDAFISIYQTLVFDRRAVSPTGILAKLARFIDRFSCRLADKVLLDTQQHINFFINDLLLDKNKFHKVVVGSDDSVMCPRPGRAEADFLVHFHGEFQALHGTEYIVEAARLLPEIKFQMIGTGKKLKACLEKANEQNIRNINFIPAVPYGQLPAYIARASVCLGLLGDTQKTQLVIPHKVYEALAMAKPVITADTPAIRELLIHEKNVLLCEAANPQSLAEAIMRLKNDDTLRQGIAEEGHKVFKEKCAPAVLGKQLLQISEELLNH